MAAAVSAPSRPIAVEPFQRKAWQALGGPAKHVLLYGGSRSGKTHLIVLWLVLRALAAPKATHAVLRHRFNHLKASIIYGTLPEVCERHWPGQKLYELNKTDWYADFVGGGRVYFGGLDEKARTEKILGQGHTTIYLNECSQIALSAHDIAMTRLSQDLGLNRKAICDENPPIVGHWTHQLWIAKRDPSTRKPLEDADDYVHVQMNPRENPHLPEDYKRSLQRMTPKQRARFWDGQFGAGASEPLWTYESIERARIADATPESLPDGVGRMVVAVDPSGCSGPEDKRSDEVGIAVVGVDDHGRPYVLEDASGRMGPNGPRGWAARACEMFHKWGADHVVGETNYGGAMVKATIETYDPSVPFREVTASRGKHVRAEPVATLFGTAPASDADEWPKPRAFFCGSFPELEAQLIQFSSSGYTGDRSPDRADAMVWGCYALGVVKMPGQGLIDWMASEANAVSASPAASAEVLDGIGIKPEAAAVALLAPPHITGNIFSLSGRRYIVQDGRIDAHPDDVDGLLGIRFRKSS